MATSNRKQLSKQYAPWYSRMSGVPFHECWYCGDTKTCWDHCPPLHYADLVYIPSFISDNSHLVLIPSCDSCNSLLGCRKLFTPNERISWLLGAYTRLFDKAYYGWTPEEVDEMGYNFKVMINHSIRTSNSYVDKVRAIERKILTIQEWD